MACAPPKTCQNQKSFWIPSNQPPNTCREGCANFFLQKHVFMKHPNVHGDSVLDSLNMFLANFQIKEHTRAIFVLHAIPMPKMSQFLDREHVPLRQIHPAGGSLPFLWAGLRNTWTACTVAPCGVVCKHPLSKLLCATILNDVGGTLMESRQVLKCSCSPESSSLTFVYFISTIQ